MTSPRGNTTTGRTWRRVTGAGLLTAASALVIATWPTAAQADPAVRTGWWNTVSGGGQSAPQPTTPDGGMHVAVAPGQIVAYGAVLYDLAPTDTATLELKFAGQGTPVLVACPTKDSSWKEGGDQPASDAPAYDCSLHSYTGSVSADGTTVTFLVDGGAESTPGELSLAIVPYMTHDAPGGVGTELPVDSTTPFSIDIDKPDVSSFTVTSAPTTSDLGGSTGGGAQPPAVTNPSTTGNASSSGATGSSQVPNLSAGGPPPATSTTTDNAAPVVAPTGQPQQPGGGMAPAASGAPATNNTAHNAALVLLVLVAMAVVGSTTTSMQRSPRLLGGAGRHAAAAGAVAAVPVAVAAMPLGVRGLGRFARDRSQPPRPLV
jgi:hypothetical protein